MYPARPLKTPGSAPNALSAASSHLCTSGAPRPESPDTPSGAMAQLAAPAAGATLFDMGFQLWQNRQEIKDLVSGITTTVEDEVERVLNLGVMPGKDKTWHTLVGWKDYDKRHDVSLYHASKSLGELQINFLITYQYNGQFLQNLDVKPHVVPSYLWLARRPWTHWRLRLLTESNPYNIGTPDQPVGALRIEASLEMANRKHLINLDKVLDSIGLGFNWELVLRLRFTIKADGTVETVSLEQSGNAGGCFGPLGPGALDLALGPSVIEVLQEVNVKRS